jgi:hypothetical protein
MATLDGFIDQIRAAGGDTPEAARLEDCLRMLQRDDSDAAVIDHDRIVRILCRPQPLIERIQAIIAAMEGRRQ